VKKIIGGKVYDTDKAHELGVDGGGDGMTAWAERLYQKRTGEYFIYGKGGPGTKYAQYVDSQNAWTGGEVIQPQTLESAMCWAENHLDPDEYADIFGMPDDGEAVAALNVQIDAALMARLRAKAASEKISVTACVVNILKSAL